MSESARREIRAILRTIPDLEQITLGDDWTTWSRQRIEAAIPFAGEAGRAMEDWLNG